jgi:hypothetical protein
MNLKSFGSFSLHFLWNVLVICSFYILATYFFLVAKLILSGKSVHHLTHLEVVAPLALLGGLILTLIQRKNSRGGNG